MGISLIDQAKMISWSSFMSLIFGIGIYIILREDYQGVKKRKVVCVIYACLCQL